MNSTVKTALFWLLIAISALLLWTVVKSARDGQKDANGNIEADYTLWTSVTDLKTKRFYFRTYENSQIRMVDLSKMNLDSKTVITIPMKGNEVIKSVTP